MLVCACMREGVCRYHENQNRLLDLFGSVGITEGIETRVPVHGVMCTYCTVVSLDGAGSDWGMINNKYFLFFFSQCKRRERCSNKTYSNHLIFDVSFLKSDKICSVFSPPSLASPLCVCVCEYVCEMMSSVTWDDLCSCSACIGEGWRGKQGSRFIQRAAPALSLFKPGTRWIWTALQFSVGL